jgi:cell division septum initiation protein DivIVA
MRKLAKLGATKEIDFFLKDLKRRHRAETSAILHQDAQEANRARETKIKADYAEAKERSQIENERIRVQSEAFEKVIGASARLRESGGEVYVDTEELLNRIGCCETIPRLAICAISLACHSPG